MDEFRKMAKDFFFWAIKDAVIDMTILLMALVVIGFAILSVRIWRRDRKNDVKVKSGMKASQIRPTPVVVPMPPMPPSSTNVIESTPHGHFVSNGPDRLTGNVTRIVFVPGRGKAEMKPVSSEPEDDAPTQPIEVTPDGETSEGQHRSEPGQDRVRTGTHSGRARRPGQRRRSGRRNRGTD